MGWHGYNIKIDESLFSGRRKYNRGRLLIGNFSTETRKINNNQVTSKRNYGNRVNGPWVFGMVCQKLSDIELKQQTNKSNFLRARYLVDI